MLREERLLKIIDILDKEKFVTVERLSELLYFSRPTIRRDLSVLEREGRIRRSHGGAMLGADTDSGVPIGFRSGRKHAEKLRICRTAAELVSENDVIFIDGSSTASGIASLLRADWNLTVVTNSLAVAELLGSRGIRTYCTGGLLIPESRAFAGSRAEAFIRSFRADLMLFSSSALSCDGFICDWSDSETSLRRAMLECSRRKVFLCDESKLCKSAAFVLCPLSEVDTVVSDGEAMLNSEFGGEWRRA